MNNGLPSHGNPEGQVYGVIGDVISTDEGKAYIKTQHDTLNLGWEAFPIPQPLQFESLSLTGITGPGVSPVLQLGMITGSSIVRVDVSMVDYIISSYPLTVSFDSQTPIYTTSGSFLSFVTAEFTSSGSNIYHTCTVECPDPSSPLLTVTLTKVGGYGPQYTSARAYSYLSSTTPPSNMVLQLYGTNAYSTLAAICWDCTNNRSFNGSNYSWDIQGNTTNNPTVVAAGGQMNFEAALTVTGPITGLINVVDVSSQFDILDSPGTT